MEDKNFNAKNEVNKIVEFIKDYYKDNNLGGAVLGISGGKDSAVVVALLVKALGKENVIGVTMPCHSKIEDSLDAKTISDYYGFKLVNFDITSVYDAFKDGLKNLGNFNDIDTVNSDINLKPRLRMSTLYYLSALYTSIYNKVFLVAGTSNKCELFVGYFTKGGDSVHDISLIADFTVDEVIALGEYLKVPSKVLYKTPSDGLSDLTDEEKLGIKYNDISNYIKGVGELPIDVEEKISRLHKNSNHKFVIPTYRR